MKKLFFILLTCFISMQAVASELEDIIEQHRKMLVLLDGSSSFDPAAFSIYAARHHYVIKHERIHSMIDQAEQESDTSSKEMLLNVSRALIDKSEQQMQKHPADLLAFVDLADELLAIEEDRGATPESLKELIRLTVDLEDISNVYRNEYTKLLNKFKTRGLVKYEPWQDYITFLKSEHGYEELLNEVYAGKTELYRNETRGSALAKDQKDQISPEKPQIIWGNELPDKTVVLTFDDGPSHSRTPKILDILKEYEVKAYFFSVGRNLGKINKDGKAKIGRNKRIAQRLLNEGHILANHSFSHPVLTKLKTKACNTELSQTNVLIKAVSGKSPAIFRPPYGSQNDQLGEIAKKLGLISVMWNIDSLDWADPIPEAIADRVLRQLDKTGKGILLFHDIHKQTVKALPDILAGLHKRGFKVVTLDGTSFDENKSGIPQLPKPQAVEEKLYGNSWAVVIGINNYELWPKLKYAVNDARGVAETLNKKLGFPKENIIELYDENATRERITEVLGYQLANDKIIKKEDRVFIFYAGHGMTRELAMGGELGYIIPVDAELGKFQNKAISMSLFDDFSRLIPAKHVYFVMDSCYSGLALTRSGMSVGQSSRYLKQVTQRRARQILTAGGADQQVADNGPGGHSIFTWTLLQGLEGLADTDNNGYVTASELGTYVAPVVSSYADQTPAFGNLVGSRGGDFVFKIDADAMAQINKRMLDETASIEAELEALRNNTQAIVKRRLELQVALEQARTASQEPGTEPAKTTQAKKTSEDRIKQASKLNASAMRFFKKKRFKKAKKAWKEAVRLNPYNPTIVNNYAFVLDHLNENNQALKWYYRTIELDARRIAVYLNLGDIMVELKRPHEAIPYYERYLHLYPSYKKAKELRKTIQTLGEAAA